MQEEDPFISPLERSVGDNERNKDGWGGGFGDDLWRGGEVLLGAEHLLRPLVHSNDGNEVNDCCGGGGEWLQERASTPSSRPLWRWMWWQCQKWYPPSSLRRYSDDGGTPDHHCSSNKKFVLPNCNLFSTYESPPNLPLSLPTIISKDLWECHGSGVLPKKPQ